MALSAEQILVIRNYVTELQRINPSGWVKDLTSAMDQFDVSPSMLQEAYSDISVSEIQSAYNESNPTGKFSTSRPQPQPQPEPEPQPSVSEQNIRDVYQRYLNRSPNATELQGWLDYSKTNSPEQTANAFLAGARDELTSVTQQGYQAALNRAPTEAEVRALVDYAIENGAQAAVDKFNTDAQAELDRARQPEPQPQAASAVNNIKRQLRLQYDAVVAQQPELKYKFEDRLDSIFENQAKTLADAGITDITQVGRKFDYGFDDAAPPRNYSGGFGGVDGILTPVVTYRMYLIDKRTGKRLETSESSPLQIADDQETPVTIFDNQPADQVKLPPTQIWGSPEFAGGRDMFNVVFNDQNQPVFLPVWEPLGDNKDFGDFVVASVKFLLPFYIPVLGEALHSTAFGQAIGATASNVLAGGTTGAIIASAAGGDPLKGFVSGAVGSFTSTTYANQVGKALGIVNDAAATIVGNGIINSLMSGVQAEVLGADVAESMLAGFGVGAITANPAEIANLLVGGEENLAFLVRNTNLSVENLQNIITTSVANSLVTEMRGGNFADALGENLLVGGVSTSAGNQIRNLIGENLSPQARESLVTIGRGAVDVGVRAELNNQNVRLALENAAPYIFTAGAVSYQQTLDAINNQPKLASLPEQSKLLLATLDTGTLNDATNSLEADVINSFVENVQNPENFTNLGTISVSAQRTILDDALKLAMDVWDRMSSFLGEYANYQKDQVVNSLIGLVATTQDHYAKAGAGPEGVLATNIQALDRVKQSLNKLLSAEAIQDRAASLRILKEAENGGFLDQVLSGFEAFVQDPAGYTSQAMGSVVPNLVLGGITSGASFVARLLPQIYFNVATTVGGVKNSIYEAVFTQAKRAGLSDVEATALGTEAQAYGGANTDMMALAATISAATTVFPGSFEQQLIKQIAAKSARDVALRAVTAGLIESFQEGVLSAQNSISQNLAINRIPDPREQMIAELGENTEAGRAIREMINQTPWQRALTQGVWGQAVVDALSGGVVGAGASLGLSAADINQWAQENAVERGDWELLDAPGKGSELIVKNFFDPEVIDVFVREVGAQQLTGPDGDGAVETETPLLTGPTDQEVIDVTDITGDQDVIDVTDIEPTPSAPDSPPVITQPVDVTPELTPAVNLQEQVASILSQNLNDLQLNLQEVNLMVQSTMQQLDAAQTELQNLIDSGDLDTLSRAELTQIESNLNNLMTAAETALQDLALTETKIDQIVAVQGKPVSDQEAQTIIEQGGLPEPDAPDFERFPRVDIVPAQDLAPDPEPQPEPQPEPDFTRPSPITPVDVEAAEPSVPPTTEPEGRPPLALEPSPDEPPPEGTVLPTPEVDLVVPPDGEEEPLPEEEPPAEEDEVTPLRPILIFEQPGERPNLPFSPRVTGEALASILGAKKPLFAGDPEKQRAVWNKRSLKLLSEALRL
jgi:hypothetical protein